MHPLSAGCAGYFGKGEYSGRVRELENRFVVGGMRRLVECQARIPGLRAAGLRLRHGLEQLIHFHPEVLRRSFPGQARPRGRHFDIQLRFLFLKLSHFPFTFQFAVGHTRSGDPAWSMLSSNNRPATQKNTQREGATRWCFHWCGQANTRIGRLPFDGGRTPGAGVVSSGCARTGGHTNCVCRETDMESRLN